MWCYMEVIIIVIRNYAKEDQYLKKIFKTAWLYKGLSLGLKLHDCIKVYVCTKLSLIIGEGRPEEVAHT